MRPPLRQNRLCRPRWPMLAALFTLLLAGASQAQSVTPQPPQAPALWLAASNHTLDQLRGGFDMGGGLMVSFGVSRTVSINGQLVSATSFQVDGLSRLSPAQAATLGQQLSAQTQVVQNGPGNTVLAGAMTVPMALYVQNTLNNQTLQTQTVIQAASNGLSLVKNLNLQTTLNTAIADAIRNR